MSTAEVTLVEMSCLFTERLVEIFSSMALWLGFTDLSSFLRDGSVIEEEERRGSSSESSACLVGTTTQGPENTPPPKGKRSVPWKQGRPMEAVCEICHAEHGNPSLRNPILSNHSNADMNI